ncbi:MAG: murein biosynthesis integral membrane protein MurJ [Candidatus Omnitrophica bacterium]|nr:murein biosynthesis integral membrane protein MurJ [Candidatus Omnitrophota bacterium]
MSKTKLIKSTGVIGVATALSRVLGFIRDIVIARFFGTAIYAQAFVVAFRIPNLLRDLVGEGATNAAIVPVLTEELAKKGKKDFFKLAQVVLNILLVVLAVLTVLGILFSPLIIRLIAPGFSADQEKFRITVTLTRFLFPFLIFVGLWAYAMGLLNSLGKFAAPAFGPCLLNISMILCAMWFGENVFGLATGVLAGGALQLFIQIPPLISSGWKPAFTREFSHPKAKKIGVLLVPRAMGACVYQVNVFVSTILASLSSIAGDGAVAALYYANRIWQLPLAIFGIALAQAALPAMSRHVALNDMAKLKDTLSFSLKILFFILIPSSIGLMVLSAPITRVLFERGAFTSYSTGITSSALFFYAIGLVACGGIKVLVSTFYSMHDTLTPVKIASLSLVLNIALNLALMGPLKVGGLALATSIAAAFNFIALYILLKKRLGDFGTNLIISSFLKVTLAGLVMALALKASLIYFPGHNVVILLGDIAVGIAAFAAACYIFKVNELKEFLAWITKKR